MLLSSGNPHSKLTRYGNAFAAGFLTAAALVHLLPDAYEDMREAFPNMTFPFDGLLSLIGACAVFVVDVYARRAAPKLPVTNQSPTIANVLAATLSFHSLIEGFTLGASISNPASFAAMAAAILAHKFFAALTIGCSLSNAAMSGQLHAKRNALIICFAFSSVTPLGAAVGAAVMEVLSRGYGLAFMAALTCLSAGVFLYVGFVELVAEEFRDVRCCDGYQSLGEDDLPQRMAMFLLAAASMSALAVWT